MTRPDNPGPVVADLDPRVRHSLFLGSVVVLVVAAAFPRHSGGNVVLIAAACVCLGVVGWTWHEGNVSVREVLVLAFIARLVAFPLLPGLSDDGFRYVWDGWIQADGINPYLHRPSDTALDSLHESFLYSQLNSPDYYSVYPPASQLIFWVGGLATTWGWEVGWYTIKAVFITIEYAGLVLVSRIIAPRLLVLYAWHPLVVLEGAGQAHTEVAMAGFILMSIYAYRQNDGALSVGALSVAGWFKLYPLLLVPFLLRRVGWKYLPVSLAVSAVVWVPYVHPQVVSNIGESLQLYVRLFEFNAGPYLAFKEAGYAFFESDIGKLIGPLLQCIFLFLVPAGYLIESLQKLTLAWTWTFVIGALWLTATTVHPWYLLGALVLIPVALHDDNRLASRLYATAWMWLSVGSLATYLFYSAGESAYWMSVWVGWAGWTVLMAAAGLQFALPYLMRQRAGAKWRWISERITPPETLLDLGAGDGYVGEEAAKEVGEVVLADVVNFNQTDLDLILYDGSTLPFEEEEFDVTLLSYVLHHCENPQRVLDEARRVTRGRVVVMESIAESRFDQLWLPFADRLANRFRSDGKIDEQILHFNKAEEWRSIFMRSGYKVVAEERRGTFLHKRHLFVLE